MSITGAPMLTIKRSPTRARFAALAAVSVPLVALVTLAIVTAVSHPTVSGDPAALARVTLPFGGGSIQRLTVIGGREQKLIPTTVRGDRVWPTGKVPSGERVTVEVTVARPGWISWLAGGTEQLKLTLTTPTAHLVSHYLTTRSGQPLALRFRSPVAMVAYGADPAHLTPHVLAPPASAYQVPVSGEAGTVAVAAAVRPWEQPRATSVSWFPPGTSATVVANPSPGTTITADTPIKLTFNKSVRSALGTAKPLVSPASDGTWQSINAHTIEFQPTGYGYGLGAKVSIGLPAGIRLAGGAARWTVPAGSTARLQQLLAIDGYLPFDFKYSGTSPTPTIAGEIAAATSPPAGTFTWRYPNVPSALRGEWSPGSAGVMTRGAVMAFETDHGIASDGDPGPLVWKALIDASLKGERSTFGYTYVSVSEGSPESIDVWHNGRTVVTAAVNTGIAAAPTATGTYPVFEHLPVTTMSGTNPDGSHYSDPGIPWVSYFNGGDALHGFIRASYGSPQSLGCVEMPYATAGRVYPYTPIGTLVHVA